MNPGDPTGGEPTEAWQPDFSHPLSPGGLPDVPGVRLENSIGKGGYATVYRGRQLSVDRDVAVKVDDRRLVDDRDKRRFTREIVAAGAVSAHPHMVTVYDGGITVADHPYLVMELYPGGSYSDRMKRTGPVAPAEVRSVGLAIADALAAAHAEGILHRDVKPGNILISRYGTAALADFGLAALPRATEGFSVTMESLTPSYAPPEAFGGASPTAAMDIYSLGATLYAMLLGRAPRSDASGTAPPLARLLFLLNEPLPEPSVAGVEQLMPIIWRATAYEPSDRYRTAGELRNALAAIPPDAGAGANAGAGAGAGAATSSTARRRTSGKWWIGAAALVSALTVGAFLVTGGHPGTVGSPQAVVVPAATTARPGTAAVTPVTRTSVQPGTVTSPLGTSPLGTSPLGTPATVPPVIPVTVPATSVEAAPPAGTCWSGIVTINVVRTASEIPCARSHYWEAYATGLLDPSTPSPYLDDVEKDAAVKKTCTQAALAAYLGPKRHGTFTIEVLPPREVGFTQGRRTFWCLASERDVGPVTGSLRGA